MARIAFLAAALGAALLASPAAAAGRSRIAIGPVAGDRRAAVATQLAETLCGSHDCVLWPRVSTGGRADPVKLRRARVAGVVTGTLRAGRVNLVFTGPAGPLRWRGSVDAERRLPGELLDRIAVDLERRLRPPEAPPAPTSAAPPPAPAEPPPLPPALGARPPAAPAPAPLEPPAREPVAGPPRTLRPEPPALPPPTVTPARPAARASPERRAPRLVAELGGFWNSRALDFEAAGAGSGTLYTYDAKAILGPRGRLEVYPGRWLADGAVAGLGLFGEGAFSMGLSTEAPSGEDRTSQFTRLSAGALWRLPAGSRVVLVPEVGWASQRLSVDPAIPGLPDAELSGVEGRLGAELALTPGVTLLAGAGYVRWLSAGDLVEGDPAYFPGGDASALEAELGADVAVGGPFSVRVVAELSTTTYDLDPDPSGTYRADGADDRFVGAHAAVRAAF